MTETICLWIDPPGCGCVDCIMGCSRPATPKDLEEYPRLKEGKRVPITWDKEYKISLSVDMPGCSLSAHTYSRALSPEHAKAQLIVITDNYEKNGLTFHIMSVEEMNTHDE